VPVPSDVETALAIGRDRVAMMDQVHAAAKARLLRAQAFLVVCVTADGETVLNYWPGEDEQDTALLGRFQGFVRQRIETMTLEDE